MRRRGASGVDTDLSGRTALVTDAGRVDGGQAPIDSRRLDDQ